MEVLRGSGASGGIAVGNAFLLPAAVLVVDRCVSPDQVREELIRLERALAAADAQLERIQRRLTNAETIESRDIVETHRYMLSSADFVSDARRLIREQRLAAESAVRRALDRIKALLAAAVDPYLRERQSDVDAVAERLLRILMRLPESRPSATAPAGSIAIGHEVSPVDIIELKRAGVKGLVTQSGGRTSHAAIVARSLGLPYVVGVDGRLEHLHDGTATAIDGRSGEVIIEPDPSTERLFRTREAGEKARTDKLHQTRGPAVTADGTGIHLAANLGSFEEIAASLGLGAESVGLFRTELAYLDREQLPTETEQIRDAVAAVRAMQGRPVTFRTLDVGADKLPASVQLPRSENPALGVRSIRFSLRRGDIFRTQLRALYAASATGPVRIMFPLVSGMNELRAARAACAEVRGQLAGEQVAHDPGVPIGIMLETPSATMIVDHLARECDFFSIGTNDLVQYLLAAGREDVEVGYLYRPLEPSVLRVIAQAVAAARVAGKPVALCGDMAGDPAVTWILLGLGLRNFSMDPLSIPAIKSVIQATRLEEAERVTARALAMDSGEEIERMIGQVMGERFPLEMGV